MTIRLERLPLAAASLLFPPAAILGVRSACARIALFLVPAAAALLFFGLHAGPGFLLWVTAGLGAAVAVLASAR